MRRDRLTTAGLAGVLAAVYFLLRPENHFVDTVLYALGAEVKDAYIFFHWHHLLYTPLNWVIWHGVRIVGINIPAFTTMSAVSALAAGGAAAFVFLTLRRWGADYFSALVAVLGAATAAAWWYFGGEGEVLALISFFLAGELYLVSADRPDFRRAAGAGAWLGVAILFHQTLVLFAPFAAALLATPGPKRFRRVALFGSVAAAIAGAGYILIPLFYYEVHTPADWLRWVTNYVWWGDWGRTNQARLLMGVISFVNAFAAGPRAYDAGTQIPFKDLLSRYGPAVLSALAVTGITVTGIRGLWRNHRRVLIVSGLWLGWYHCFFTWWEAENVEWWIAATLPLWLLAGLVPKKKAATIGWAAGLALIAVINLTRLISPATVPGNNDAEAAARTLVAVTRPGDAIFISHVDTWAWTDYLSHHQRRLRMPFNKPAPGFEKTLTNQLLKGFKKMGGIVYFTDYEWDEPSLAAAPNAPALKALFFGMIRSAQPVAVTRFPGREAVIYRFKNYDRTITSVNVYEPATTYVGSGVVLDKKRTRIRFDVDIPTPGDYTVSVQSRTEGGGKGIPRMRIEIDGWRVGSAPVDTSYLSFSELDRHFSRAGRHTVTISDESPLSGNTGEIGKRIIVLRIVVYRLLKK